MYCLKEKHLRKCIAFLMTLFFSLPLAAQEETGFDAAVIASIEIIGLKRTKYHIANSYLEKFLGQQGDSFDQSEVFSILRNTGILELHSAELIEIEEGLLLRVTVEEKWSFLPLPMFFAGSGDYSFGLFLINANAFGQLDQIALGAMYGTEGFSGMAMYNHTPNRRGLPSWNTFVSYGRQKNEDLCKDEFIHRRYTTDQFRTSVGLNYNFFDIFTGSTSASFAKISVVENENSINPPENGVMLLTLSPGLSIRKNSWDGFLQSQQNFSLRYGYNFALQGASFHQIETRSIFEQSLIPGFHIFLKTGAVWRSYGDASTNILFEYKPQSVQIDILPQRFSARYYAGASAGLEKHLVQLRWGTLSLLGSWQCVFSHGDISADQFDHGPSGGIRFYLSRIALPAIGLNMAYNMNSGLYQIAFNIGMEL
jgi:hypothetical protein